jgi:hypothetical protein
MRLSLDALLVLDAINRKGSFAAAADELHRAHRGKALQWFVKRLQQPGTLEEPLKS